MIHQDRYWIYRCNHNYIYHFISLSLSIYIASIYLCLYISNALWCINGLTISISTASVHMYIHVHGSRTVESVTGYTNTEDWRNCYWESSWYLREFMLKSKLIHDKGQNWENQREMEVLYIQFTLPLYIWNGAQYKGLNHSKQCFWLELTDS